MSAADWIAVDWGTTELRAYGMRGGRAVAQARSGDGMGTLSPGRFEPALIALVGPWLRDGEVTQVVACGMVGSRQGWVEAPYRAVPCTPLGSDFAQAPAEDRRLLVQVIPGLKQSRPADVMRGEETQVAGFLSLHPGWDGVLCLPGTHSKWVQISAGEVVSFQTFLTGEMFAILSTQSVLRHSLAGWDVAGLDEGIAQGFERPEKLTARLFSLRAEALLHGLSPERARARLSGLLIGAELAAARPYWLGQRVAVVGHDGLARAYVRALDLLAVAASAADATEVTLAGLASARTRIGETTCAR